MKTKTGRTVLLIKASRAGEMYRRYLVRKRFARTRLAAKIGWDGSAASVGLSARDYAAGLKAFARAVERTE